MGPAVAYPQAPGTIVHLSREAIGVVAGDGRTVAIEQLQPEGKRPMSVGDFLAGHPLASGVRLSNA